MAIASKDLTAVNSTLEIDNPNEYTGEVIIQYESGAGTVVLEGSLSNISTTVWGGILMTSLLDGSTSAAITAAGLWKATVGGLERVRVRKSVGAASCVIRLGVSDNG